MKKEMLDIYTNRKKDKISISTKEYKGLKRELVANLHEYDDGFIVAYYYDGIEKLIGHIDNYMKLNLNDIDINTIKIMNYINSINVSDLEYMKKHI